MMIGIDLGTTNSVMAYINKDGNPEIIPNNRGERLTPSVVSFTKEGDILVGQVAKNQMIIHPETTILSIKRKMGTDEKLIIKEREYTPEEISAIILKKLKEDAETFLGEKVDKAVITVPAYFNDNQRNATINAAKIAGLEVARIINEPTSAALSYGFLKDSMDEKILIVDFGGGTYDVSILDVGDNVFEVLATAGDNRLGGDDIDRAIVDYVLAKFKKDTGIELSKDRMALQRVYDAAVQTKIALSESNHAILSVPFITADENGPKHLEIKFSRSEFEELVMPVFDRLDEPFYKALDDAGLTVEDIDKIIFVGGSTRIPFIEKKFEKLAKKKPYKNISPDECVAIGAAIQAGILEKKIKTDVVLVDVTPFTLGIMIENGKFAPIIPRNTPIPVSKTRKFTTISDYQTSVEVSVYQGENDYVKENVFLGDFELTDIKPAPKGEPDIEVTFSINENGVLVVTAKDLDVGVEKEIEIKNVNIISDDDVNKIVEKNKQDEKQRNIEIAETLGKYEKRLEELQELIKEVADEGKRMDLANLIRDIKEALEKEDISLLKELYDVGDIFLEDKVDE